MWEPRLIFVGTVLDFSGGSGAAIDYRTAQATKVFHRWRPWLLCKLVPQNWRLRNASLTVIVSLLWLSSTWHPAIPRMQRLESWCARWLARTAGVRRSSGEDMGVYWQRLHRSGHLFLKQTGGAMNYRRRLVLHRFAGHAARESDGVLHVALRTRNLYWWRAQQCLLGGVRHPKRFKSWRWETQICEWYDQFAGALGEDHVDWLALTSDRALWKANEELFAARA